jgi:arabinofuranan 3-O-arabinosyltransferase
MASYEISPCRGSGIPSEGPVELIAFALIVAHAVFLITLYVKGMWLVQPDGGGTVSDFLDFWAAGYQVLQGHPIDVYDPKLNMAAQAIAVGHPIDSGIPFFYPPTFLFLAAVLALFPYVMAYVGWGFLTMSAYVVAIRGIIGHRAGILLACAFPAVVSNLVAGQTGFLTATLLAGALGFMERQPVLAGSFLGVLTIKPQFGILFPLILIVSGRWRMFGSAAATTAFVVAASWFVFGGDTWGKLFFVPCRNIRACT